MYFNYKTVIMIIYLAALAAFPPFSTDVYLASMPVIAKTFAASNTEIQLTLSLFFVSFALMQLFWGPLSDRIGRKIVVFLGLLLYFIASLICARSNSIELLIGARILQAIGACAGIVMAMAIVKDSFPEHHTMSRILSIMLSVMVLTPMVAPIIGSFLLVHFHWRANFYFLASYVFLLLIATCFLKESYPAKIRKPLALNQLFTIYREQIHYRPFLLATFAVTTNFSIMFAFIASSPFIYIKIYHIPAGNFGYFFAINASALILGNISLANLKRLQLTQVRIVAIAVSICLCGALAMLIAINIATFKVWSIVIPAFIATFGSGILYTELTTCALQNVVTYNGIASALLGMSRFIFAGFISLLKGVMVTTSALPLGMVMFILSCLTGLSMWRYFKQPKLQNINLS